MRGKHIHVGTLYTSIWFREPGAVIYWPQLLNSSVVQKHVPFPQWTFLAADQPIFQLLRPDVDWCYWRPTALPVLFWKKKTKNDTFTKHWSCHGQVVPWLPGVSFRFGTIIFNTAEGNPGLHGKRRLHGPYGPAPSGCFAIATSVQSILISTCQGKFWIQKHGVFGMWLKDWVTAPPAQIRCHPCSVTVVKVTRYKIIYTTEKLWKWNLKIAPWKRNPSTQTINSWVPAVRFPGFFSNFMRFMRELTINCHFWRAKNIGSRTNAKPWANLRSSCSPTSHHFRIPTSIPIYIMICRDSCFFQITSW